MPEADMEELIDLAHLHDFIIVSDECYSELYYDDNNTQQPAGGGPTSISAQGQTALRALPELPQSFQTLEFCRACAAVSSLAIAN